MEKLKIHAGHSAPQRLLHQDPSILLKPSVSQTFMLLPVISSDKGGNINTEKKKSVLIRSLHKTLAPQNPAAGLPELH